MTSDDAFDLDAMADDFSDWVDQWSDYLDAGLVLDQTGVNFSPATLAAFLSEIQHLSPDSARFALSAAMVHIVGLKAEMTGRAVRRDRP